MGVGALFWHLQLKAWATLRTTMKFELRVVFLVYKTTLTISATVHAHSWSHLNGAAI